MLDIFEGAEGQRRLLDAICGQEIVLGNKELALEFREVLVPRQFEPGDDIIKQNEAKSDIWLILTGSATINIDGRDIAIRIARTQVGEMALLDCTAGRCASVRAETQLIAGKIPEEDFLRIAKKYPILWQNLARSLASRLRDFNKRVVRSRNHPPRVFIGSSNNDVRIAERFKEALTLDHQLFDVKMWKSDNVFILSRTIIENLINSSESSDFAILIFGEPVPRDNVVFELGLFMGALGRDRTFAVMTPEMKMFTDIDGLTVIKFDIQNSEDLTNRVRSECNKIKSRIEELGPK